MKKYTKKVGQISLHNKSDPRHLQKDPPGLQYICHLFFLKTYPSIILKTGYLSLKEAKKAQKEILKYFIWNL